MEDEPFLIAHKVRGERALDVAVQMRISGELAWIIPTSGHRAYPYWTKRMQEIFAWENVGMPPEGLRDHYVAAERKTVHSIEVSEEML